MVCPQCNYKNSDESIACVKCATPLPTSDHTLAPDHTLATGGQGWSVPAVDGIIAAGTAKSIEVGTLIGGRYEIIALLGQGGMGAVYKAHDNELDRLVALKIIRPDLTSNPEILKRFKQELILARQVTHRNVIRIFDLGQADGFKFITMEYLEGQDLRAVLREKGKLSPKEASLVILQICRALEAAHGEGVVHRDLKPQNIMMDAKGRAYVMDFGIARSAYLPGMTQTGALVGTPEYMSPEQAKGEKLDERSDLFSLGVIFYELLVGQSPYYSDTPLATLWKRIQEKAKPPCEVNPSIPKPLSDIIEKALEIDPANRIASAKEFAQQLELWLGPSAASSTIFLPAPPTTKYWKWAAALATFLVAAVIVVRLRAPTKPQALHAPVSVLVADFTNHTGDPIFDQTLEPMFNVALEGASFINAFNRGSARRLAAQLPHPADMLTEQPARLVAVSQGIGAIVTGELSRRGDQYSLSATALDAVSGNVIAKSEATARNKDEVLLTIPKLAAPIRKALGDATPESVQLQSASGAFTTSSLEAVHQYGLAMNQQFAGNFEAALASFSKAAELDPSFARAYAGEAAVAGNLGQFQDAEKYAKLAMEHVDHMTERERYRIRGMYYIRTENWQKCVEEYTELLKLYPADNIGRNNIAACYAGLHDMPRALEEARRAVELAPKDLLARNNYSLYACYTGDFQTCEREAYEVRRLNASSEEGFLLLAHAQTGRSQFPQAAKTYQELKKLGTRGKSLSASGLADLAIYEGSYRQARQILESAVNADLAAKQRDRAADNLAMLAFADLSRGDKSSALAAAEKALANSQSDKIRFLAARTFLDAGEAAKSRELASVLGSSIQSEPQSYSKLILGEVALGEHDPRQALQLFTDAQKLVDTWIVHLDLGRAYLDAGAFAEADSEFDRCIKRGGEALELFSDDMPTYSYLPLVYYFQGLARDGLKSSGASDSFRTYLRIREKAGEDPLLPEIRRRLGQ